MKFRLTSVLALALLLLTTAYITLPASPVSAQNYALRTFAFTAITSTTTYCGSFPQSDQIDIQVYADVATVNTTTLDYLYTNDSVHYTVGGTLSSSITTDTPLVAVGNLYTVTTVGKDFCLQATVANTNPVTVTAVIFGKVN